MGGVNRGGAGCVPRGMTAHLRRLVLVPALLVGGLLAACGDDDDDAATQDTPSTTAATGGDTGGADYGSPGTGGDAGDGTSIVAEDFTFTSLTVPAGSEVTFENADDTAHTLTADDGAFDTGDVAGGASATFTAPGDPGEYAFHCEIHPSMTGTLTVEG